jgi:hypothetical protein
MTTRDSLRALVTAALVVSAATGAAAMAQTADPAQSQSQSQPADTPSMSRQERRQAPESQHAHPRQPDGGMMGGHMMGGHMMGGHMRGASGMGPMGGGHGGGDSMMGHRMMGGCPMMSALPPGNEKLAMRMHGEIMVAIGNILIKNADNIQPKPAN